MRKRTSRRMSAEYEDFEDLFRAGPLSYFCATEFLKCVRRLVLFLMETSGALSPPARRHLRWLHRRSKGIDRTPYDSLATRGGGCKPFVQFWTQRLSAAVVTGDARRTLNAISACVRSASVLGCTVVTSMRDRAYLREATRLADVCDEAAFVAAFGEANDPARLGALVDSNTITLPLLLRVAPAGTPDPTPLLYNDAFHALAASSMLATLCNIAVFMVLLPPRKALGRAQ